MESLAKRYFWVINLVLVALLAFFSARVINNLIAEKIVALKTTVKAPKGDKRSAKLASTKATDDWAQRVIGRNLFNSDPPEEVEDIETDSEENEDEPEIDPNAIPQPGDKCEESKASIALLATMVAEPSEWSVAVLESDGDDRLAREGVSIDEQTIVSIQRKRIVLTGKNGFECIALGEGKRSRKKSRSRSSSSKSRKKVGSAKSQKVKEGVKKVGKNTYEIDREMLNEQLEDLSALSRQARVIPHYREGKPQGFKLVGVRPGSLYSHIGVRSGDVLKAVNGEEITSPTKALELYEKLKNSDNVTVDVERRGRKQTLEYMIK